LLTALRRKELVAEPSVVKLLLHDLAVVDAEVVHYHNTFVKGVNSLKLFDERQKGIDCV
jgi:hypothetical protein